MVYLAWEVKLRYTSTEDWEEISLGVSWFGGEVIKSHIHRRLGGISLGVSWLGGQVKIHIHILVGRSS